MASKKPVQTKIRTPRQKGSSQCPHHQGSEVVFVCESCDAALVCGKCVTSVHRQHRLLGLTDVIPQKKEKLQSYIDRVQGTDFSKVQQELKFADSKLLMNQEQVKKVIQDIQNQGQKLKASIDAITENYISQCHQLEKENRDILGKFKHELQTLYIDLTMKLQQCMETISSGTDAEVYDAAKETMKLQLPKQPSLRQPVFSSAAVTKEQIGLNIGSFHIKQERDTQTRPRSYSCKRTSERVLRRQISDTTNEVSHFQHSSYIDSMVPTSVGDHWIVQCWSKEVVLVNKSGIQQQRIQLDTEIHDISVSPKTDRLWMCTENDVRDMAQGVRYQPKVVWPTRDDITLSIHLTQNNKVVIGSDTKVAVFTTSGEKIHQTAPGLIAFPRHITSCPITGNIAVVDWDREKSGGKDQPHITVLTCELDLIYQYIRQVPRNYPEFPTYKFDPYDACYDSKGQLLIADSINRSIILLDTKGQYVKTIHRDEHSPTAISLHNNKILWVGCGNIRKTIRILQYTE